MCDLTYNITTTRVYRTIQELVFEAVLKQELAFFDSRKPGNPPRMLEQPVQPCTGHLQDNVFDTQLIFMN